MSILSLVLLTFSSLNCFFSPLLILCVHNLSIVETGAGDCAPQLGKVTILESWSRGAAGSAPQLGKDIGCDPCIGKATGSSVMEGGS